MNCFEANLYVHFYLISTLITTFFNITPKRYQHSFSNPNLLQVVQSYQDDVRPSSSRNSSRTSSSSRRSRSNNNQEYFFGEETLQSKWRSNNNSLDDATSVSSFDEWVRCESSQSLSRPGRLQVSVHSGWPTFVARTAVIS